MTDMQQSATHRAHARSITVAVPGLLFGSASHMQKLAADKIRCSDNNLPSEANCHMSRWELGTQNFEAIAGVEACVRCVQLPTCLCSCSSAPVPLFLTLCSSASVPLVFLLSILSPFVVLLFLACTFVFIDVLSFLFLSFPFSHLLWLFFTSAPCSEPCAPRRYIGSLGERFSDSEPKSNRDKVVAGKHLCHTLLPA